MSWTLRFHGVGNASAAALLGSAMGTIEHDGRPWLSIDCGAEGLADFITTYGHMPEAVFVTHTHLDHVSGFEQLFVGSWFDPTRRGKVRVYCPAQVVPLLNKRVAEYPNALAEGGVNFWDAFQLIAVGDHFWHDGVRLEVFPVRHHWPDTAFGLRLPGSLVWTGDTRPIPEMLVKHAADGELIAHDCGLHGNPSHTGVEDFEREYAEDVRTRCVLYHYADAAAAEAMRARGHRVAAQGDVIALEAPRRGL